MSQVREIKRRIKSINNTKKITKAMELVAASKMRKAVDQVVLSRNYSQIAWQVVQRISLDRSVRHPLFKVSRQVDRAAVLVISSNRGLCGGFNTNLTRLINSHLKQWQAKHIPIDFYTFGQKVRDNLRLLNQNIVADFNKPDLMQDISLITPISQGLIDGFVTRKYQRVFLIYTDFVSSLKQVPLLKQILPLRPEPDENIGQIDSVKTTSQDLSAVNFEYKFEPSPIQVLDLILPRILETQIYQAVLESDASEHSARMMAMQNASNAADDMVDGLTLAYNQARQAAITQEIAEIVGGVAALSK